MRFKLLPGGKDQPATPDDIARALPAPDHFNEDEEAHRKRVIARARAIIQQMASDLGDTEGKPGFNYQHFKEAYMIRRLAALEIAIEDVRDIIFEDLDQ